MIRRAIIAALGLVSFGSAFGQATKRSAKIRALESAEVEWLSRADAIGRKVLQHYRQPVEADPKTLDVTFRAWKVDRDPKRPPERVVAEGLGVVYGNYVAKHKVASWVVVTDSFGADFAVRSPNGGEIYPISSVWKRIDPTNDDEAFFEPIWTMIIKEKFNDR